LDEFALARAVEFDWLSKDGKRLFVLTADSGQPASRHPWFHPGTLAGMDFER